MNSVFVQLKQFIIYEMEQDNLVRLIFIIQKCFCIYHCIQTVANFLSLVVLLDEKAQAEIGIC